jgi:hypothetical protein
MKTINNPATALNIDNIFDRWGIDITGGLPVTDEGFHAVLTVVEYLTKFAWAFPLKTKSADEIVKHLQTLICTFGPPGTLLSDAGREFINMIVAKLCEKFAIIKRTTSAYNPRVNGGTERVQKTLIGMLIKLADNNPTDWPSKLDVTLLAYRTSVHSTTGHTPFQLMFGRRFGQFDDYIVKDKEIYEQAVQNRLIQLKELFDETHAAASKNITKSQIKQVNTQNRQTNPSNEPLEIGSTTYVKDCRLIKGKMEPHFDGPFKISGRNIDSGNYLLQTLEGENLKSSYPRWKLKPTADATKIISLNDETSNKKPTNDESNSLKTKTKTSTPIDAFKEAKPKNIGQDSNDDTNEYSIQQVHAIGRGFRYLVKYKNGRTRWIKGSEIDQKILNDYLQQKTNNFQKIQLNPSLIISIIIAIGFLLNTVGAVRIDDDFIHCQTKNLNRIIKPNPDCNHPKEIKKSLAKHNSFLDDILHKEKLPSDIMLLSRNKYYMNEIGYQCFKTLRTTYLNETWLFKTSRSDTKEVVHLTRSQCIEMVESKLCGNNQMTCNNDGCWYYSKPIEVYYYNWDNKIEINECSFIKKQVVAQFETSQLYFSPSNQCQAKNLECKLFDSIIIWQNSSRNDCLLTNIHNGTNYTLSQNSYFDQHNILYSTTDNLSFQITSTFFECNVRLFKTTTDAYILFKNDPESKRYNEIANSNEKISFNRQHDINNIILAETDNTKHLEWYKDQENIHQENFLKCKNLKSNLDRISLLDDTLNVLYDLNGNLIYTYTLDGIVYLPYCTPIKRIFTNDDNKCYLSQPILYETISSNQTSFYSESVYSKINNTGFLTTNNIIRDDSPIVQCDLIRTNQLTPSNQYMLIRRKQKTTVIETSHLIIHDISQSMHVHTEINFNHHQEIISNYQQETIKLEFEKNQNTIDDEFRFYSIPFDQHVSEMEYKSKTTETITELKGKVIDYIATSTIVTSIIGGLTTLFFIYLGFKILMVVINNCIIRNSNHLVQPNRIAIDIDQQRLLREYELRRLEQSIKA